MAKWKTGLKAGATYALNSVCSELYIQLYIHYYTSLIVCISYLDRC